jgi:hypothetical protein
MQTAEETCNTDKGGDYSTCTTAALTAIEPTIAAGGNVTSVAASGLSATGYTVTATSSTGTNFIITKSGGTVNRTCTATAGKGGPGTGGCQTSGTNGSTW